MKTIALLIMGLICMVAGWTSQQEAFNFFLPTVRTDQVYGENPSLSDFEKRLGTYTLGTATVAYVSDDNRAHIFHAVSEKWMSRFTSLKEGYLNNLEKQDRYTFETSPAIFGRQPLCLIQYKSNLTVFDKDQLEPLAGRNPDSLAFGRAASYHEVEHCMMPQWMLRELVAHFSAEESFTDPASEEKFSNYYLAVLSEIFADTFATTFMPEDQETTNTLLSYRKLKSMEGKDLGPYKYNLRVLEKLSEYLKGNHLENTEENRLRLFKIASDALPLPTAKEIKHDLNM